MSSAKSPESFISTFYEMVKTTVLPLTLAGPTLLFTGKVKKIIINLDIFFDLRPFLIIRTVTMAVLKQNPPSHYCYTPTRHLFDI